MRPVDCFVARAPRNDGWGSWAFAPTRLICIWASPNDESDDRAVTTVTSEEKGGKTLLVMRELCPSKESLDGAIAGMEGGMPETFAQLVTLGASAGRS